MPLCQKISKCTKMIFFFLQTIWNTLVLLRWKVLLFPLMGGICYAAQVLDRGVLPLFP